MRLKIFLAFIAVMFANANSKIQGQTDDMAGMRHGGDGIPSAILLTLGKAEELALSGNPHIRAADDRAQAAGDRVLPALFPDDPMFEIDNTIPGMDQWMIEEKLGFPGKGIAQADVNGAEAKKSRAEASVERRSIVLQARQAFWEFYYRQKVDGLLQEAEKNWKGLSQLMESKELSGQWLSVKTIRMQMEMAKAVNELITNSRALKVSQFNLNHLFSLPHGTTYNLPAEITLSPFAGKEEDYVQEALLNNSEIEVYRDAVQQREASQSLANFDYLPDFDVWVSGIRQPDGGFSDYGYRLGVSLPLFFPAKQSQEAGAESSEASAARYDLKGKQDEVIHMVEDAYVNAESAWRLLRLYQEGGLLRQTQKAWTSTQLAYHNEEMPLAEFVENYNVYLETFRSYYEAQADYGKALAELDYQAGDLKGESHEN
jgi:outer membrane protein, heavy metal efflux system